MRFRSTEDLSHARVVAVFTHHDVDNPARPECVRGGWIAGYGDFCGFAAKAVLADGRRVRAPLREALADAERDRREPERVEWIVVDEAR